MTDHQIEIDDLHEALAEKDAQIADLRKQLDWYRQKDQERSARRIRHNAFWRRDWEEDEERAIEEDDRLRYEHEMINRGCR